MAKGGKYRIWFPYNGEIEDDAAVFTAASAKDAAEMAAELKCNRDVEWRTLVPTIRLPGGEVAVFDVTVRSEPVFYARER